MHQLLPISHRNDAEVRTEGLLPTMGAGHTHGRSTGGAVDGGGLAARVTIMTASVMISAAIPTSWSSSVVSPMVWDKFLVTRLLISTFKMRSLRTFIMEPVYEF